MIDLRDIKTNTQLELDKSETIKQFEKLINGIPDGGNIINQQIYPTTNRQYRKGI